MVLVFFFVLFASSHLFSFLVAYTLGNETREKCEKRRNDKPTLFEHILIFSAFFVAFWSSSVWLLFWTLWILHERNEHVPRYQRCNQIVHKITTNIKPKANYEQNFKFTPTDFVRSLVCCFSLRILYLRMSWMDRCIIWIRLLFKSLATCYNARSVAKIAKHSHIFSENRKLIVLNLNIRHNS